MTTTTYTISVPPKFWADHAYRCVERDVAIAKGKGGRIVIELTGDEIADLHSDADYYSCPDGLGSEFMGLVRSARATLKAIEEQVDIKPLLRQWRANQQAEHDLWKAQQQSELDRPTPPATASEPAVETCSMEGAMAPSKPSVMIAYDCNDQPIEVCPDCLEPINAY